MATNFEYIFYGTSCDPGEVDRFMDYVWKTNQELEEAGRRQTPLCIWGRHGIGKTDMVAAMAQRHGAAFVSIAPAQFEEMGDLMGMPVVVGDGDQTRVAPPEWVPQEEGPGVLLIDDVNRADDRILRGLMQLFQNYELAGWSLPRRWQIVLTANPDGGDYSVTPMDDAMLTRMLHVTMRFDVKRWAAWAEDAGIDPRGIAFALTYPELVTGERTTPRTLVQFFERIAGIEDLGANLDLVTLLGESCLDKATVSAFLSYVQEGLEHLIAPEEILDAKSNSSVAKRLRALLSESPPRVDILSAIATRLAHHLHKQTKPLKKAQLEGLKHFLLVEGFPEDLRLALAQELTLLPAKFGITKLFGDPKLSRLLLSLRSTK
ncbi:MAG: AAA family ATPase [Myxococcota bacterium]